jgi:hypothetical protein
MWEEAYANIVAEEQNYDREQRESKHYDHEDNVETTYERALREAKEVAEEEVQADYERDDKMGAI